MKSAINPHDDLISERLKSTQGGVSELEPNKAERSEMKDIGFYVGYRHEPVSIYKKLAPNRKADLAERLISHFGVVAGTPDGEDSKGRAKVNLMPPAEVVQRACEIADLAIDEFDKRGWYLELPEPPEEKK
jgi:hypothetical protein